MHTDQVVMYKKNLHEGRKILTRVALLFNLSVTKQETTVHNTEQTKAIPATSESCESGQRRLKVLRGWNG